MSSIRAGSLPTMTSLTWRTMWATARLATRFVVVISPQPLTPSSVRTSTKKNSPQNVPGARTSHGTTSVIFMLPLFPIHHSPAHPERRVRTSGRGPSRDVLAVLHGPLPHVDDVARHRLPGALDVARANGLEDRRVLLERGSEVGDATALEEAVALELAAEGTVGPEEVPVAGVLGDPAVEAFVGLPVLAEVGKGRAARRSLEVGEVTLQRHAELTRGRGRGEPRVGRLDDAARLRELP